MCMGSPSIKTAAPVQEVQTPDINALKNARKKLAQTNGGSLLTSPTGVDNATTNLGATTLLGS